MKLILKWLIFLIFSFNAQLNAQEIFGDWIKTKVTYLDGAPFPDENILKYQFIRYTFDKDFRLFYATSFDDRGTLFTFGIDKNKILIKNTYGYLTNTFLIREISDKELILIQKGRNGFSDNDCIVFFFKKEKVYQDSLILKTSDIVSVTSGDTVYRASKKIHSRFIYPKSFDDYCAENIPERNVLTTSDNTFLYTFILRKTGIIDSIHASGSINKKFDRQFRKALIKSQDSWEPARLNSKKVDVQMEISFRFYSSDRMLKMLDYYETGKELLINVNYKKALYNFKMAEEIKPDDHEVLYFKAICELNLGLKEEACNDLKKIDKSGKMNVGELIKTNCK